MNNLTMILAIVLFLAGVFLLRRLWLGALAAVIIMLVSKIFFGDENNLVYFELANAVVIWVELILLIFGAFLFYDTLTANQHFDLFTQQVTAISSRISLAIIICFFIGSFMEGIAGFGIPALLVAPLMLKVGFRPLTAVVLPLASIKQRCCLGHWERL